MSKDKKKEPLSDKIQTENQLHPDLLGINTNMASFSNVNSATRMYMAGGNISKSVVTKGNNGRRIIQGFEYQYGDQARKIEAPSNMLIEKVFFIPSLTKGDDITDKWNPLYVIFKNDEKNCYDILEMPKYHTQNTYMGFEFKYNRKVMSKLKEGATFPKGTVFAQSPRVSDNGEWCFTMDLKICAASFNSTEEDGVVVSRSCARDKLSTMFKHEREFQWLEREYIPLMLYKNEDGTSKPFPEPGDKIREDGIVMGFRRRDNNAALVTLTKKALEIPDQIHDILFVAPPTCEVMSVEVISERIKDRSHNRNTNYIPQAHNLLLDKYEKQQNQMWNDVLRWYGSKRAQNGGNEIPMSYALDTFIRNAYGNYTISPHGKPNPLFRAIKRQKIKDWKINILLKEEVPGRVKFKMTGTQGDKGIIVKVMEDEDMPTYPDGTRADMIVNNTPAFRRQIFSMLMIHSINFISNQVHKEIKELYNQQKYKEAYNKLYQFVSTGFPEFADIINDTLLEEQDRLEWLASVVNDKIVVHSPTDSKLTGVELIKELRKVYNYKPDHITFTNELGERVTSKRPVLITNADMILLDKMGTDMSSQALASRNIFGFPAPLNELTRHANAIRVVDNRNTGETEGRVRASQTGIRDVVKNLALSYSPENSVMACKRIIRADDPFDIDQIIKPEEYPNNRATKLAEQIFSDAGYIIRKELPKDRTK